MLKTPVSVLQELVVQKKLPAPDYHISGTGEPHRMSFTCQVKIHEQTAIGFGATKKDAKQDAAKNMLKIYEIELDLSQAQMSPMCLLPIKTERSSVPSINYVGSLNELCSGRRYPQPDYSDSFTQTAQFCIVCSLKGLQSKGYGLNKKEAKQEAAKNMLALLSQDDNDSGTDEKSRDNVFEENSDLSKEVVKKYTELIQDMNVECKKESKEAETIEKKEIVGSHTWDDLTELLDKHGYMYELKTFQKNPLILSLKIKEFVLLDSDQSSEKIKDKLASKVVTMIKDGFDFSKAAVNE